MERIKYDNHGSLFCGELVTTSRIIYTPSPFARENLVHLQEVGKLKANRPHISSRKNLSSYLFFIVVSGTGTLTYKEETRQLNKGDCGFIDCKYFYAHQSSQNLWTLKWVHFYGENMMGIYDKYIERGGSFSFYSAHNEEYEKLIDEIYEIANSSSYIKDMYIAEKLMKILTLLMEDSWNPKGESKRKTVGASKKDDIKMVKDFLDMHYREKIVLDDLAGTFFINKFSLERLFREYYGYSINNYVMNVRITHAKELLRFSSYNMEQIALEIGINDSNYFSRVFKKIEGVTPSEYRKKWQT